MPPRDGEAAMDSPQRTQRTQRETIEEIERRITDASQGGRKSVSRGAATDGSQGWSEQSERNPWDRAHNAEAPEGRRTPEVLSPLRGFVSFRVATRGFAALHPWLPSVAASAATN